MSSRFCNFCGTPSGSKKFCSAKCSRLDRAKRLVGSGIVCKQCGTSDYNTSGQCIECNRIANKRHRQDVLGMKERIPVFREDNGAKVCNKCGSFEIVQSPSYVGSNRWRCARCDRKRSKKWRDTLTPEKYARWRRKQREFFKRNPDYHFEALNKRMQAELMATPDWLTEEQWDEIDARYAEAKQRSTDTGVEYHVDHIIPLRGKEVCGLHVPWNLQVITAKENLQKHAKLILD